MKTLKTLKSSKSFDLKILDLIFILIGGKFYMDYLLITNPKSKNILIRKLLKFIRMENGIDAYDYRSRYSQCISLGIIHIIATIICLITYYQPNNFYSYLVISKPDFIIHNLLTNVYPIIVQFYIGYRLHKILKYKNSNNYEKSNSKTSN